MHLSQSSTDNDSYVKELTQTGSGKLQHYTTELNEKTLYITGAAGSSIDLTDEKASGLNKYTTLGFHLAGVDIPHPQGHMCEGGTCATTKPYQKLCWVQRCAKPKDSDPWQVAWVLSLVNGSCPEKKDSISCGGSTSEGGNYTWQILEEHADAAWDVGSESCTDPNTCDTCCTQIIGGINPYQLRGNSCTTKGEKISQQGGFAEFRSGYVDPSKPCTCSFNTVDYICQ